MNDKKEKQTDSRRKILDAAAEEFALRGLAGSRVDRIAQKAGVNKAMIYYHFSSKEGLYKAMIDGMLSRVGMVLKQAADPDADLEKSLLSLSLAYHDILGSDSHLPRVLLHEMADGGRFLRAAISENILDPALPARMQEKFGRGSGEGEFRDVDGRHAMLSFVGMNLFYLMMSPIANSMLEIEDAETFREQRPGHIVDLFMRGLEKR